MTLRDEVEEENRSQDREAHVVQACAVKRHMDRVQEPFCIEILPEKCRTAIQRHTFSASLRNGNAHGHFTRAVLRGNFTGKMPGPNSGASILREPAQSKRTWTCHKTHFVWKFTGTRPHAPATTSIEHRALTVTARTPSVWPHCLGKNFNENQGHHLLSLLEAVH